MDVTNTQGHAECRACIAGGSDRTAQRARSSRRNTQFRAAEWALVVSMLRDDYSPARVVGWFARCDIRVISNETIYRHIWKDKKAGETLHVHLRLRPDRSKAQSPTAKTFPLADTGGALCPEALSSALQC
jgi:IS30 family transposase